MHRVVLLAALVACSSSGNKQKGDRDRGDPGVTSPATGYASPTTGEVTDPNREPDSITVSCEVTDNLLRYVCEVSVEPAHAVQLRYWRTDGESVERTHLSEAVDQDHSVNATFLAAGTEYTFEATAIDWPDGASASETLTTGDFVPGTSAMLSVAGTSTTGLVGTESPCSSEAVAVIFDSATGDVVWFHDLDAGGTLGILDMVRFTDEMTIIGETNGNIVEVDIMGNDLARFPVDYPGCCSLNHDIFKADGMYWSQYQNTSGGLTLDNVVVIDDQGVEQYQWDPADHLNIPGNASGDYLHTNTEFVDADGNFYLSWLTRDAVGKFIGDRADPNWGDPIWLMTGNGQQGALGNDITLDWSAVGGLNRFSGQHNLHLTNDGRVMLLDNDGGRGLVITVDENTMTGTVDAEYPTHEGSCGAQGTAMDTKSGNVVVACSTDWLREFDGQTQEPLWEAQIQCENGGGGWLGNSAARWYPLDSWQ